MGKTTEIIIVCLFSILLLSSIALAIPFGVAGNPESPGGDGSTTHDCIGVSKNVICSASSDVDEGIEIYPGGNVDGQAAWSNSFPRIFDVVTQINGNDMLAIHRINDYNLPTISAAPDMTINIKMLGKPPLGTIHWSHEGQIDEGAQVSTNGGQLGIGSIQTEDRAGGQYGVTDNIGIGIGGGGVVSTNGTWVTTSGQVNAVVTDDDLTPKIRISKTAPGSRVSVYRSAEQINDQLRTQGLSMEIMAIDFGGSSDFDLEINSSDKKTDSSLPPLPNERSTVGYVNIEHSANDEAISQVRFNFRVSQDRLDEKGIPRDEVVLYRYTGENWTELETEFVVAVGDGSVRYRAISPGLSVFAIGSQHAPEQTTTEEETNQTLVDTPSNTATPSTTTTMTSTTAPVNQGGEPGDRMGLSLLAIFFLIMATILGSGIYYYKYIYLPEDGGE